MKRSVVPWKDPDQFKKVYEYAYSDDVTKRRWAVEQMTIWETRCWPSLPTAVEATHLLVRAKIQDTLYRADKSLCGAQEVEMMYSNSVVRFVNLILENDQNTKGKIRLSHLAEKRNIPAWIIDVRHNATHGHNPTLPVLRMAYETIMEYLKDIFWLPETARISAMKKVSDENPFIECFQEYKAVQMQKVLEKYDRKKTYQLALKAVLKKMGSFLSKYESRKKLIEILVHPDYFVTEEDVNSFIAYDDTFINNEMEKLPDKAQEFWIPAIKLLHKYDSIPTFLELLLLSQNKRKIKVFQKVADALVLYILTLLNHRNGELNQRDQHIFKEKRPLMNWQKLLYSCMIGCSAFADHVFQRITKELKPGSWKEDLAGMLCIKQGKTIDRTRAKGTKRKFDITFTADDLEEDLQAIMKDKNEKQKKNPFSLTPVTIDYSKLILGHVFNPVNLKSEAEIKKEKESISVEDKETLYEGSEPIEISKPTKFLFKEVPTDTSMIYRRRSNIKTPEMGGTGYLI